VRGGKNLHWRVIFLVDTVEYLPILCHIVAILSSKINNRKHHD
jgi:hypothetical protein